MDAVFAVLAVAAVDLAEAAGASLVVVVVLPVGNVTDGLVAEGVVDRAVIVVVVVVAVCSGSNSRLCFMCWGLRMI